MLAVTAQLSTQAQPCEMRMVTIILKLKSLMKWRVRGRPWLGGCRPLSSMFVNPRPAFSDGQRYLVTFVPPPGRVRLHPCSPKGMLGAAREGSVPLRCETR